MVCVNSVSRCVDVVDCINFDPLFSFQFGDYISHMQLQKESADVNV